MEDPDFSMANLCALFDRTPVTQLGGDERIVIFSDLHLGDGGRSDDFLGNSDLFLRVANDHYLARGFHLILNGDVEELQRFSLTAIRRHWTRVYALFDRFQREGRLTRLYGNHDMDLRDRYKDEFPIQEAVRFAHNSDTMFVLHGHQTSRRFERYNRLVGLGLKIFAKPLNIKNYSVSYDSRKRFKTEQCVYEFASKNRVMTLIGHTHRPLFESLSKLDNIKFEIERLCRKYPRASATKQTTIERAITSHRDELKRIRRDKRDTASVASLYNADLVVPCMFNSGAVIGKRGLTCLEIAKGRIALVHWFDDKRSQRYLHYANYRTTPLAGTDYHRVRIKRENLDYIFTRIKLLA